MGNEERPVLSVRQTKDGSPTLFSEQYQQTYHSIHGSLTESNHIFLNATGIRERIHTGLPTKILEVGLGTGMNFLLTAQEAQSHQTSLQYWAFEHTTLSKDLFLALHLEDIVADTSLLDRFAHILHDLEDVSPNTAHSFEITDHVQLHVLNGDATEMPIPNKQFHAVYQDAFSPDVNPELWTPLFFERIYNTMHPGGRLTTFSVRRLVRDNLAEAGFQVHKKPGPPGGKREMVVAIKPGHE